MKIIRKESCIEYHLTATFKLYVFHWRAAHHRIPAAWILEWKPPGQPFIRRLIDERRACALIATQIKHLAA